MFLHFVDPCRYNFCKKRLDTTSEIVPLFEESSLIKCVNVKLLAIYSKDPIIYSFSEQAKLIYNDKYRKLTNPEDSVKISDVYDMFFTNSFFDLCLARFDDVSFCLSRIEKEKWKMSALLTKLEEKEADSILKTPSILINKYEFEEKEDHTESNTVFDISTNTTIFQPDEKQNNTRNETEEDEELVQQIEIKEEIEKTVKIPPQNEPKNEKKPNLIKKVIKKVTKLFKKNENGHESNQPQDPPGYIILGTKTDENIIQTQKKNLSRHFDLSNSQDVKFINKFLQNDLFFLEINCAVKLTIVKEPLVKIFVYCEVDGKDDAIACNLDKMKKLLDVPLQKVIEKEN